MTPLFQPTRDKAFASRLIQHNMMCYYKRLDMHWDDAVFDRDWRELESYQLVIDTCPVGLLCINRDDHAYYIRELQIAPTWQRQGLGAAAIRFTHDKARREGVSALRLRVFCINPARALYERMGFHIRKTQDNTHYMERPVF
ncbi:GNAT family N-acetyltransferase [Vreelandella sp. EE7]